MNTRSREASDLQSDAIDRSAISPFYTLYSEYILPFPPNNISREAPRYIGVQLTALPSPLFILYIVNTFYHFPLIILAVKRPDTSGCN